MKKSLFLFFLSSILLWSCKKDNNVFVHFNLHGTNKTANNRNYAIDLTKVKILFSNFKYVDANGNEKLVKDVFLYKNDNDNFSFKVPDGTYTSFKFSFGLDSTTNNSIPMSFAASNPLSVEEGLYWDMLKYRFLILEGKVDDSATKDQIPNSPFSMHLGTDTIYTEIISNEVPQKGATLTIDLDLDKLFVLDADPFLFSNFSNHCSPSEIARAVAIKNSFVNNITTKVVYSK